MDPSLGALSARTTSAFAVSIGTSLALESMLTGTQAPYDPERVLPPRIVLSEYDGFWVNLLTLYRNIRGAMEPTLERNAMAGDLLDALVYETELIRHAVEQDTHGKTQVHFYASTYSGLARAYPHASLRKDSTPKQLHYSQDLELVVKGYFKHHPPTPTLHLFDLHLKSKVKTKALVLTHYAHDLLSWKAFSELDLIESHTGLRKKRVAWASKLTGGKDLVRVPFCKWAIQFFGDPNTFAPFPIAARKQVLALADQYEWNGLTTPDRVVYCLDTLTDKLLASTLKSMM